MTKTTAFAGMMPDARVFSVYVPMGYRVRQHKRIGIYRSWNTVCKILFDSQAAYATVDGVIVARSAN